MSEYIGVNGAAKKIAKGYIGVGGVARKILKGYIGDENGIARLFFGGSSRTYLYNYDGVTSGFLTRRLYPAGVTSGTAPQMSADPATGVMTLNFVSRTGWIYTAAKVDLTGYSKLGFNGLNTGNVPVSSARYYNAIGIAQSIPSANAQKLNNFTLLHYGPIDAGTDVEMDISSYTGEYYILFSAYGTTFPSGRVWTMNQLWLE